MLNRAKRLAILMIIGLALFVGAIYGIHVQSYTIGGLCALPLGIVGFLVYSEYKSKPGNPI